jgi:hypothetical protein
MRWKVLYTCKLQAFPWAGQLSLPPLPAQKSVRFFQTKSHFSSGEKKMKDLMSVLIFENTLLLSEIIEIF